MHDPECAVGLPAHVPLLVPFLPQHEINDSVLISLVTDFARHPAIGGDVDLCFDRTERISNRICLGLGDPSPITMKMTALARAHRLWHVNLLVPLLTVACGDPDLVNTIESELRPKLPLVSHVSVVSLFVDDASGRWRESFRFRLH